MILPLIRYREEKSRIGGKLDREGVTIEDRVRGTLFGYIYGLLHSARRIFLKSSSGISSPIYAPYDSYRPYR